MFVVSVDGNDKTVVERESDRTAMAGIRICAKKDPIILSASLCCLN